MARKVQHALVLRRHADAVLDELVERRDRDLGREKRGDEPGVRAVPGEPGERDEEPGPDRFAGDMQRGAPGAPPVASAGARGARG